MGQFLSTPQIDKESEEGSNKYLAYGISCMQGWRISMEDSHSAILNLNKVLPYNQSIQEKLAFFAIFDGHGGDKAALFAGKNLPSILKQQQAFDKGDYSQSLKDAFLACDRAIIEDETMKTDFSGCAATSIMITNNKLICANAGDSRTIMSINGNAKPLSFDHKPSNDGEAARICAAGGFVEIGRVNGNLALSRAIGDFEYKKSSHLAPEEQIVTAYPDIIEHDLDFKNDEFVVLACDGIWDCLTSTEVVELVRKGINDRKSLKEICELIMDICVAPSSIGTGIGCDNMSICIIALLNGKSIGEWYDHI
ncbi:type 2C protein phosphatase PTC2, partial [Ascoidea rubescens DSM 1968]